METRGLPSRWSDHARRLPSSLEDLSGPAAGTVVLPLPVAWSGRRVYDVSDERQRHVLYALLLAEAQREDLQRFLHRDSLVSMWPRLRRLLGPHARRAAHAQVVVLRNRRAVRRFLADLGAAASASARVAAAGEERA